MKNVAAMVMVVLVASVATQALDLAEQHVGGDLVGIACLAFFICLILYRLWEEYGKKKTPGA